MAKFEKKSTKKIILVDRLVNLQKKKKTVEVIIIIIIVVNRVNSTLAIRILWKAASLSTPLS